MDYVLPILISERGAITACSIQAQEDIINLPPTATFVDKQNESSVYRKISVVPIKLYVALYEYQDKETK